MAVLSLMVLLYYYLILHLINHVELDAQSNDCLQSRKGRKGIKRTWNRWRHQS